MNYTASQRLAHFFHVVSNIRPIIWIGLYVCITPLFALVYWALPDGQFRIPDGDITGYGSWLYYSIVTITTLGFGDYTPAHGAAQAVTAVEVMCGLIFLGLFLNAVGAMKSEIDVESEIEKQKRLHHAQEREKLIKSMPMVMHGINMFLECCSDFKVLADDKNNQQQLRKLMHVASKTSLTLDSLQQRIDLTLWPQLLEYCFAFVANCQMFPYTEAIFPNTDISAQTGKKEVDAVEVNLFIKENSDLASKIEVELTKLTIEDTQPIQNKLQAL